MQDNHIKEVDKNPELVSVVLEIISEYINTTGVDISERTRKRTVSYARNSLIKAISDNIPAISPQLIAELFDCNRTIKNYCDKWFEGVVKGTVSDSSIALKHFDVACEIISKYFPKQKKEWATKSKELVDKVCELESVIDAQNVNFNYLWSKHLELKDRYQSLLVVLSKSKSVSVKKDVESIEMDRLEKLKIEYLG